MTLGGEATVGFRPRSRWFEHSDRGQMGRPAVKYADRAVKEVCLEFKDVRNFQEGGATFTVGPRRSSATSAGYFL